LKNKNHGIFMLALMTAGVMPLAAQDAGSLLRQQEQQQQQREQPAVPEPEASPPSPTLPDPAAGPSVTINTLTLTGETSLLTEQERRALITRAQGQTLDFDGLQVLAEQITQQLQQKGHLLARAVLPRQDVTDGSLEIQLLEGTLESWEFSLGDSVRLNPDRLSAIGERSAPPGKAVHGAQLERGLLLMNDLPGISASARLEPGEAANTSRLITRVEQSGVVSGSAWVDNYGNWTTGRNQANALLSLNDPLGTSEQLTLQLTYSEGLRLGRLGLETGLGARGLRVNAGVTALDYDIIDGGAKDLDLSGRTRSLQLGASYPIVRSRRSNVTTGVSVERKDLRDEIGPLRLRDKRIHKGTLRLSGDRLDGGGGFNTWSLAYTAGDLDLSGVEADEAADAQTLKTAGVYHKLNASLLRLQPLPGSFTLLLQTSGQWANKNLDSSEGISLGGPFGVRAYPVNEASGDLGWLATAEIRYDLPPLWRHGRLQLAGFYDAGGISINQDVPTDFNIANASGRNSYSLSGAGLMTRLRLGRHVMVQTGWARAIGDNPGRTLQGQDADGKDDRSRIWLQASAGF